MLIFPFTTFSLFPLLLNWAAKKVKYKNIQSVDVNSKTVYYKGYPYGPVATAVPIYAICPSNDFLSFSKDPSLKNKSHDYSNPILTTTSEGHGNCICSYIILIFPFQSVS